MAKKAISRLQDWLCTPLSSPSCFLSSPPHSMGRQLRGPRQALIAFTLLSSYHCCLQEHCLNGKGACGRREAELLLNGGVCMCVCVGQGKQQKNPKPNKKTTTKPTHAWTHTDVRKLKIYSKWLTWNSSGPGKKLTFWWEFAQHSLLLKSRDKVC